MVYRCSDWMGRLLVLTGFVFAGCGVIGGPPVNLQIAAATDTTVQLVWTTPAQGMPDSFLIYFCSIRDTVFKLIGDTSANTYIHNPHGVTGRYKVVAMFAGKEYPAATIPSTVPVHTESKVLSELDGPGNAGYGWNYDSGFARTYSMRETTSARHVDLYITNFALGTSLPYRIASPIMAPSDPSGVVPTAGWDTTWFTDPLEDENAPLPAVTESTYFNYTTLPDNRLPAFIGVYLPEGDDFYFALIKVNRVNSTNATVELESWFQLVPGLRLVAH